MKNRESSKLKFVNIFMQSPASSGQGIKLTDFFIRTSKPRTNHKQGLRASGLSLLPLALRPLLLVPRKNSEHSIFSKPFYQKLSAITPILLVLFAIFILQNSYVKSVSAKSVTLTIPSAPLTLNVEPNSSTVFKKSSPGTISVSTDSSYGYSLSIQSKTSNDLLNGSNKITSIVSALSEQNYANSGDTNTWAYLPSKLGGSINTDFQPGPTIEPTTLDRIENSSEGTNYNLTLATKIDNTLPAGNYSNTFVLSATSNDPPYDDIIQNWADCDTLDSEESINLLDVRDNKIYSVAKLKDGQCWMTENLAIGKEDSEMTLTSSTSDVASNFNLPASEENPNLNNEYDKSFLAINETYGGYYTWFATTAGEGKQSVSADGQSVEHSICPKGWRLPTKQDFINLDKALGGTGSNNQSSSTVVGNNKTLLQMYQDPPVNFVMGSYYHNGSPLPVGNIAYYWSSTAYTASSAYVLTFTSSNVYPQYNGNKSSLYSVRCVARPDNPKKVGTMQTVDEWGDSVEQGKAVISEDIRDNKQYTVARLADGRLWMTQNLAIGKEDSEMTLTSDTSDTANDFTITESDKPNASNAYDSREIHLDPTYGGYYTWFAATAGESTQAKPFGDVSHSICPKGWRLPTNTEFDSLVSAQGAAKMTQPPASFLLGGYYSSGSPSVQGSYGYYWSSTAGGSSANSAYGLGVVGSSAGTNDGHLKNNGFSVRCVSRTDDLREIGTMQTVDEWGDSVKQGKTVISEDIRDGKKYTAVRLADGRLWMTENLAIGKTDSEMTLTPDTSDTTGDFTLLVSNDRPNPSNAYDSREIHLDPTYGGYYTWYTATAGDGTQSKSSGDVSHSICPKGWRLPTSAEYKAMTDAYSIGNNAAGAIKLQGGPMYSKMGGYYFNGSAINVGSYAFYWSSTAYPSNSNYAYYLDFNSSNVYPQNDGYKFYLLSVRCVSRTDDPIMQNVYEWGSSVAQGETKTATDIRDDKRYTVARLADNKLWMTQNLAIENYNLTSADSDVASSFTLPSSSTSGFSNYDVANVYVDATWGGYYTWFAATAGEGKQSVSSGEVSHSICPKGWRLPTIDEFDNLVSEQGTANMTKSPANFVLNGLYNSGSSNYKQSLGFYWPSTAYSTNGAYDLRVNSSGANTNHSDKYSGYSVRCVSRQ